MSSDGHVHDVAEPDAVMRGLLRDARASERDRAAEERDFLAQIPFPDDADQHGGSSAQRDRLLAARDRAAAALDRAEAALDRWDADEYRQHSFRDGLTRTLSRDAGTEQLRSEVARALRSGERLVVAFLDLKGLKAINDVHGHSAGDHALRSLGSALLSELRSYDVVVRFGGDEFVCALPGLASLDAASRFDSVQERLAALCRTLPALAAETVSFRLGLAEVAPGDSLEDVIARADVNLYAQREREGERRTAG